jgi:uncharacterized protein involved in exopolysaccharide biosynthesis
LLNFEQASGISQEKEATLADLDALIVALEQEIAETRQKATELGKMLAAEGLAPGSSLTAEQRAAYFEELSALRQEREEEAGKLRRLEQERDLALDALQVVEKKLAEQRVAVFQPDAEVRLAGQALLPSRPDSHLVLYLLAGGLAGLMLGILTALLIELTGLRIRLPRLIAPQERGEAATLRPGSS